MYHQAGGYCPECGEPSLVHIPRFRLRCETCLWEGEQEEVYDDEEES